MCIIPALTARVLLMDALLPAFFLGFVFSVIFGHAPIILPAIMPVDITYRSIFYAPLILRQGALVVRVTADLTLNLTLLTPAQRMEIRRVFYLLTSELF